MDGLPEASRAFRRALSPPNAGTKRRIPLYKALCCMVVRFVLFGLRGKISVLFELHGKIKGYGSVPTGQKDGKQGNDSENWRIVEMADDIQGHHPGKT